MTAIGAFNKPLALFFIKGRRIDILVELKMLTQTPFLVYVLEVSSKILPAAVSFFEGEVFPDFLVEQLIDRSVCIDAGSRVAIPVP